jgi:hypothetical protein
LPLFEILAQAVDSAKPSAHFTGVVRHLAEKGEESRIVLSGASGRILVNLLAHLIEKRLEQRVRSGSGNRPIVPLALASLQLAQAQFALLDAWLSDRHGCSAESIAAALTATTYSSATAIANL